jgi:hypothetical protein
MWRGDRVEDEVEAVEMGFICSGSRDTTTSWAPKRWRVVKLPQALAKAARI